MSIWGIIIGGTAGFALGGPIAGLLGAVAGHAVEKRLGPVSADPRATKRVAFTVAVIALSAKMAKADGSMLGNGNIFIKEHKLWFKGHQDAFRFSETGAYSIAIKHAVRELGNPQGVKFLEGIEDVGFRIELLE